MVDIAVQGTVCSRKSREVSALRPRSATVVGPCCKVREGAGGKSIKYFAGELDLGQAAAGKDGCWVKLAAC